VDEMEAAGDITAEGGVGTGKQKLLHLNSVQNQSP
jgi:hypothetical protein